MALGTPTGLFHVEETAKTTDSVLSTPGAVPAGATVVLSVGNSIANNYAKRVTDDSGLGIVWRPIRIGQTTNTGGTPPNVAMYYAYCPAGLPSGTNLTVVFSSATSMTRIFHALYMTGQARPDKSATTENLSSVATWSMATADNTAFSSEVAIAACCNAGNQTSTDTSSPAMTEVYDTGASAASGNRGLTTQYLTGVSSGATVTASGSFSANARWIAVIVMFREYVNGNSYAAEVNADSPTNWWHLDDTSGTTAVDDPGTADGTYVNTPTLAAAGAFSASGTSVTHTAAQSEDTTLPVSIPATFSFEIWFKCTAIATAALRDNTGAGGHVYLLPGGLTYTVRVAGTTAVQPAAAHVDGGDWHHLVVTRTGTSVVVYIDGQKMGAGTGGAGASASPFHLAKNGTNANFEDISLDEAALYSSVLTWDRVRAHFDAGVSTRIEAISQATETDTAGAVTPRRTVAIGRASDTETARTITPALTTGGQTVNVAQATETDTARAVAPSHAATVNRATETGTAGRITPPLGHASETDTAGPLAPPVGRASETETASKLAKRIAVAQAVETNTARTIRDTYAVHWASEADTARPITAIWFPLVDQALETDTAATVVRLLVYQALETDTADFVVRLLVNTAVETDTAGATPPTLTLHPEFIELDPAIDAQVFDPAIIRNQQLEPETFAPSAPTVFDPSLITGQSLQVAVGPSLSPVVFEPALVRGQLLVVDIGPSLSITVLSPSLIAGQFLEPDVLSGGLSPTVFEPALIAGQALEPDTFTGLSDTVFEPALIAGQALEPDTFIGLSDTVFEPALAETLQLVVGDLIVNPDATVFNPTLAQRTPSTIVTGDVNQLLTGAIRGGR